MNSSSPYQNNGIETVEVPQEPVTEDVHSKRRTHKKRNIFLILVGLFILVPLLVAGWYGFVPGLSGLLGANKPVDLGVRYTEADYNSYLQKTSIKFNDFAQAPDNPNKPGKKTVFADPVTTTGLTLTDEELTSAGAKTDWLWMPLKNAQVKFKPGGLELSGNINVEYLDEFINFIGGVGYSQADVQKGIDYGKKLVGNSPALYVKASASVTNDTLTYNIQQVKVGRFSVPMDIASKVLSTGTTNAITGADNFEAKSATAIDGALVFEGTYPKTIYVKTQ